MTLSENLEEIHDLLALSGVQRLDASIDKTFFYERESIADMLGTDFTIDDILFEESQGVT